MKTIEQRSLAWQALLKWVEVLPVQLTFRGVNDHDQPLYEIKTRTGQIICEHGTEKEVMDVLRNQSEKE